MTAAGLFDSHQNTCAELTSVEFSETGFDSLEVADAPRILCASKAGYSRKKIVQVVADALICFRIAAVM